MVHLEARVRENRLEPGFSVAKIGARIVFHVDPVFPIFDFRIFLVSGVGVSQQAWF